MTIKILPTWWLFFGGHTFSMSFHHKWLEKDFLKIILNRSHTKRNILITCLITSIVRMVSDPDTCLLMVGFNRCCCWTCCRSWCDFDCCVDCGVPPWEPWDPWLSLVELCWCGRPGGVLSLTESCCRGPCCRPPKPDSGDWSRFPLCGLVFAAGAAAELTESWCEGCDFMRCVGGAMEVWRTGWTVEGGVASDEWDVPVCDAMPAICCCSWSWDTCLNNNYHFCHSFLNQFTQKLDVNNI